MPNWVTNTITIDGSPQSLTALVESEFDFQKLHPCPYIIDNDVNKDMEPYTIKEGWYEWCTTHWGTKWSCNDPTWDYTNGDESLSVSFQTAWAAPHGLLGFVSLKFPDLTITNQWENPSNAKVGEMTYKNGIILGKWINKSLYTKSALELFSEKHEWCVLDDNEDDEEGTDTNAPIHELPLQSKIKIKVCKTTYDAFIKNKKD